MDLTIELSSSRKGMININYWCSTLIIEWLTEIKNAFYGVMLDILILQKNILKEFLKMTKKIAEKLNYDKIEFSVQDKDFNKIEVKNNKCINLFGYENGLIFSNLCVISKNWRLHRFFTFNSWWSISLCVHQRFWQSYVSQNKK